MIFIGEVQTGLLRNSTAVTAGLAAALLRLKPGSSVAYGERPVRYAYSPQLLTGVDCALASAQAMPRGIGTVGSRAVITGGHVLQGSSCAQLVAAQAPRRMAWSHYVARPGRIEVIGRMHPAQLGEGFLRRPSPAPSTLDLASINARMVNSVQTAGLLDSQTPFRAQVTRVRWVAHASSDHAPSVRFHLEKDLLRTIELHTAGADAEELVPLCEHIAFHDWLLTNVAKLLDQSRIGAAARSETVARLKPVVDHLLHLWMPGVRLAVRARSLWQSLDDVAAMTRQWQSTVDRIRDQLSLAAMENQVRSA